MNEEINRMFYPKSIAIIEASSRRPWQVQGIIEREYQGKLYLVSRKEEEIFGIKCYKDVSELPDGIDHAIISVNRHKLQDLIKACIDKNFNTLHVFAAGGAEFDEKGEEIEKKLHGLIKNNPIRAIGPNCMGVYSPEGRISYSPMFSNETSGKIALVSHSGDITTQFVIMVNNLGAHISKAVSIGNSIDLRMSDFIEYFNNDKKTEIICVYFEGLSRFDENDGKKLFKVLKNTKKPIIFLRSGVSEVGKRAILSHTGSMASSNNIWKGIFKQANMVKIESYEEFIDTAIAFHYCQKTYPKSKNLLLIVWSGGKAVITTDQISSLGIKIPTIQEPTLSKLKDMISIGSVSNPMDLPWIFRDEKFSKICNLAIAEDYIGGVILEIAAPKDLDDRFLKVLNNVLKVYEYTQELKKPFFLSLAHNIYPITRDEVQKKLVERGVPVFPTIFRAAKSFLKLYEYQARLT